MDEQTIFGAIATALIITITAGIISIPKRIKELKFKKENPEKKEGNFKEHYENGNIKYDANFKNWKLNGTLTEYYENGNIKFKGNFINDKEDGLHLCFYENGKLKSEYMWMKNATDYKSKCYDEEGNEIDCDYRTNQYTFQKSKENINSKSAGTF